MSEIPYESENTPLNMPAGGKESLIEDIAVLNSLHYSLPSSLSSMVKRSNKVSYADKSLYTQTDSEAIIRVNSSFDYGKWQNSYITGDIVVNSTNTALAATQTTTTTTDITLGCAGIFSLLAQRHVCETKSGTQCVYVDHASTVIAQEMYACQSAAWINDNARPLLLLVDPNTGYPINNTQQNSANSTAILNINNPAGPVIPNNLSQVSLGTWAVMAAGIAVFTSAGRKKFVIPMRLFDGFYNCPSLCPSSLLSGFRIRMNIQQVLNAFVLVNSGTNTTPGITTFFTPSPITFNINNLQLVMDSYELNPLMYRKLQEKSASEGLDYTFTTAYYQTTTVNANAVINVELNKAVARALYVNLILQSSAAVQLSLDPNQSLTASMISYNSRVGSLTFPGPSALVIQTPLTIADVQDNSQEYYHLSQMAYKKCADDGSMWPSGIRYQDFSKGFYNFTQPLETSSLSLQGIAINNSRSFSALLNFYASLPSLPITANIACYIHYVSVLKVFLKESVLKL